MAITYYCSSLTGSDTNSGTSVSVPLKTVTRALALALSRTDEVTIVLAPGTYTSGQQNTAVASSRLTIRGDVFGASFTGKTGIVQIRSTALSLNRPVTLKNLCFENTSAQSLNIIDFGLVVGSWSYGLSTALTGLWLRGGNNNLTIDGCIFKSGVGKSFAFASMDGLCPRDLTVKNCFINVNGAQPALGFNGDIPRLVIPMSGTNVTARFYHNTFYHDQSPITNNAVSSRAIIYSVDGKGTTFTLDCKNNAYVNYRNMTVYFTHYASGNGALSLTSNYNYYNRYSTSVDFPSPDGNYYPYAIGGGKWNMLSATLNNTTRTNLVTIAEMRTSGYDTNSKHGPGDLWWGSYDSGTEFGPRLSAGSKVYFQANSPAADAGTYLSTVATDIWDNTRANPPDIGCWDSTLIAALSLQATNNISFTRNRVYISNPSDTATYRRSVKVLGTPLSWCFVGNLTTDVFELPQSYTSGNFNLTSNLKIA